MMMWLLTDLAGLVVSARKAKVKVLLVAKAKVLARDPGKANPVHIWMAISVRQWLSSNNIQHIQLHKQFGRIRGVAYRVD